MSISWCISADSAAEVEAAFGPVLSDRDRDWVVAVVAKEEVEAENEVGVPSESTPYLKRNIVVLLPGVLELFALQVA